ncbi:MAG: hypothetical protein PHX21_03065 [bacterium]|nr:hypothetical protein [bacterium]
MIIRKVRQDDREALLTSFKPLFNDWDYLPLVIDDWFSNSSKNPIFVACSGGILISMLQIAELSSGEWYINGLRSNPNARPNQIACSILALKRAAEKELKDKKVNTLRYGTLYNNRESLRLASLMGFKEHFRLGHASNPTPGIPDAEKEVEIVIPDNADELMAYFEQSSCLKPVGGYFFTWWDTRLLQKIHLIEASKEGLLFKAIEGGRLVGALMLWHIKWQECLVFSVMEGSDEALKSLYREAIICAHKLGCKSIGMVHPSMGEMNRRQKLFGLNIRGCETVQLIYKNR